MTVCKRFCILPDDVFGPRTQPEEKLLLCRLSGVVQRCSPLSPALEEREDLQLHVVVVFFSWCCDKEEQSMNNLAQSIRKSCKMWWEVCALFLLAPPDPPPAIPCTANGGRGAGEPLLQRPWKSSWIWFCTGKEQRTLQTRQTSKRVIGNGAVLLELGCFRAVSHSPGNAGSWKPQVEGSAAAHSWDVSGEVRETW